MLWSRVVARLQSGPWAVAGAGLAETAAVSTPWVLADLSKKRHASFYHILAIVVDFLKIEKVELPPFEKARLNGPETAQN